MNIKSILPILDWLPNYNKQHFKGDLNAGITVGIMLIPQGMAYAMLAGLPPIYGLYAAIVPQLIYAIFGTSRQLGVGPVAMDSLLVAVTVSQLAQVESTEYINFAILLALMVGAIQLLMGFLRLGALVNFLSHPVISGFTSAAAIIISVSQLKYLMGVDAVRGQFLYDILAAATQHIGETNLYTLAIGLSGMLIILLAKKFTPSIPAPLIVVISGILAVWGLGLDQVGVSIVKEIPEGLPMPQIPSLLFDFASIQKLLPSALTIALIAFMEAIAVSKAIQARHNDYKIDPNQELIALGMSNAVGSFFQSFPGTGGFSRSAVNDQAGAKTNLAAIISASFVILTLLFLTPLFYYLPKAVLASIIMVAVLKLISVQDAIDLWKKGHKRDLFILIATFLVTLFIGIQKGILAGVLLSVIGTLYDTLYPSIVLNDTLLDLPKNTLIIRFEEQLYFANSNHFTEKMETILEQTMATQKEQPIEYAILDGTHIHKIDSTGEKALESMLKLYQEQGIPLILVGMPSECPKASFPSINAAIKANKTLTV
ncbi:MAG: Sulfate permease [uncultured Aureispira sp.]|uniref:Sulfate permease n=1 Tax=uncultured Aureispira sp. TaxID=1331704 RepID=A0A6S6UA65_9BACT|nr:MAG: Sulfate permease [uncultured Aureispira sp.]